MRSGADVVPVVMTARLVCRLIADTPGAASAHVLGADGVASVEVGETVYWFFGDTLRRGPNGRRDVIHSTVATSSDKDARDCVELTFKTSDGSAEPLFPRLDETTAWPDGVLPLDDGGIAFYMVKAYRQSPFQWHVGAIGLGQVQAGTTEGVRVAERLWDEHSGFGSRVSGASSPVRVGDVVYVYLHTDAGANYVARAPVDRLAEPEAYVYWDGSDWTPDPAGARPMWPVEPDMLPPDGGVSVTFDERTGKWMALYNRYLALVEVRLADAPQGPWSEPVGWLDCRAFVGDQYPYCYSGQLHPVLSREREGVVHLTFSSQEPYDVSLLELQLGVPVHAWVDQRGAVRYATSSPGDGYVDGGVVFYALDHPAEGLSPVYERPAGQGVSYGLDPGPSGGRVAFYAYAGPPAGLTAIRPVYRWHRNGQETLDPDTRPGWTRGEVAFYAAAP